MAVVEINPLQIEGRWQSGAALDLHPTSSIPIGPNEFGHMQFETVRPEVAEQSYRLKNRGDVYAATPSIETSASFPSRHRGKFDGIVPVPPSHQRVVQPVVILAGGIGKALNVPLLPCIGTIRPASQLENITDPEERKKHVESLYQVRVDQTRGRKFLLFDGLSRRRLA